MSFYSLSRKLGTVYEKYTEVFRSQCPNLNTDYLLLDTEQINFDSYLDADLIIIGGGNTEKYLATYVNQQFKNYIDHMLNKGTKVMGFSAGALLLGEKSMFHLMIIQIIR